MKVLYKIYRGWLPWLVLHELLHLTFALAMQPANTRVSFDFWTFKNYFTAQIHFPANVYKRWQMLLIAAAPGLITPIGLWVAWLAIDGSVGGYIAAAWAIIASATCSLSHSDIDTIKQVFNDAKRTNTTSCGE